MSVDDQIRCVEAICQKLKELADLSFPAYGSLYFANTPYLTVPKLSSNPEFCIGPHCGLSIGTVALDNPHIITMLTPIVDLVSYPMHLETEKTLTATRRAQSCLIL